MLLKRLSDAERDGDTVYGVVRGSAMQHNGRGASFTAPTITSQEGLIRAALKDADVTPDQVDIIEAHGTATALGDPVEVSALTRVFGRARDGKRDPLLVGSVKANTGHAEAAAGMMGFIKLIMSLGHKHMAGTALVVHSPECCGDALTRHSVFFFFWFFFWFHPAPPMIDRCIINN